MTVSPRMALVAACIVIAAGAGFWWFGLREPPPPMPLKIGGVRTHVVDMTRVKTLELKLNDVPFDAARHEILSPPGELPVSGQVALQPGEVPSGLHVDWLVVATHPVGTSEEVWERRNSKSDLVIPVELLNRGKAHPLNFLKRQFTPGDYEMRLYLRVTDLEGSGHAFDYLGKSFLTIRAAE